MSKQDKVVEFVHTQLVIFARINGLKDKAKIAAAMDENKIKWVKMAIVAIG